MADATHFMCFAAVRGEKLRCLADIVSQTSRSASGASAGMSADGRTRLLPIVVVANTRDAVDAATSAVLAVAPRARVVRLHSDQSADERAATMEGFRAASRLGLNLSLKKNKNAEGHPSPKLPKLPKLPNAERVNDPAGRGLVVLLTTDACLPSIATGEAPLHGAALIQLETPNVADAASDGAGTFRRRVRAALGAATSRTDVSIVAADERRNFEAHSSGFETVKAPLDLHDIVVARWRASARGKDAR
jgi:hypothetical protein